MRRRHALALRAIARLDDDERAQVLATIGAFTHAELGDLLAACADVADAIDDAHAAHDVCPARPKLARADAAIIVARDRLATLWMRVRTARAEAGL